MKFKVGDKVVRTASCSDDYTVKQGGEYVVYKVDDELYSIYLEGVCDSNGQPDWFNPCNFELVKTSSEGKQKSKFNKGDKVRCVSKNLAIGVNVGSLYTVKDPLHHKGYIDKGWHVTLEEVESTPNEGVLELYEESLVKDSSKQTPFEKEGWTENSIFKVVGNSDANYFQVGTLVVLEEDDSSYQPKFKRLSDGRTNGSSFVTFKNLEYVGELGDDVVEKQQLRTPDGYRKLQPDNLIEVTIDGHKADLPLLELLMLYALSGSVSSEEKPSVAYDFFESIFDTGDFDVDLELNQDLSSISFDHVGYFIEKYFTDSKVKLKQELNNKLQTLQQQVDSLKEELDNL